MNGTLLKTEESEGMRVSFAERFISWNRLAEGGILFLIVFSPFAFGSVHLWAISLMHGVLFLIGLAWIWQYGIQQRLWKKTGLEWPLGLFAGLVCFQLLPLPVFLLRLFSPQDVALVLEKAGVHRFFLPLSMAPRLTWGELEAVVAGLVLLAVGSRLYRNRERVERLVWTVLLTGAAVAFLGIFQKSHWNGKIYWISELGQRGQPFGPFINRNHFAALMLLTIPVTLGYLLYRLRRQGVISSKRLLPNIGHFLSEKAPKAVFVGLLLFIQVFALVWCGSRGALLGLAAMALVGLIGLNWREKAVALFLVLFTVGVIGAASRTVDSGKVLHGFQQWRKITQGASYVARTANWKDTVRMAGEFPLFGVGLGAFQAVFPFYKTLNLPVVYPEQFVSFPENDFLQLLAETGMIGLSLMAWAAFVFLTRTTRRFRSSRSRFFHYTVLGCLMGLVAVLAQSNVDFGLHIASVRFYFLIFVAVCIGFYIREKQDRSTAEYLEEGVSE